MTTPNKAPSLEEAAQRVLEACEGYTMPTLRMDAALAGLHSALAAPRSPEPWFSEKYGRRRNDVCFGCNRIILVSTSHGKGVCNRAPVEPQATSHPVLECTCPFKEKYMSEVMDSTCTLTEEQHCGPHIHAHELDNGYDVYLGSEWVESGSKDGCEDKVRELLRRSAEPQATLPLSRDRDDVPFEKRRGHRRSDHIGQPRTLQTEPCPTCGWPAEAAAAALDVHTVICNSVSLLNQGEHVKANSLLREWLVAYADRNTE